MSAALAVRANYLPPDEVDYEAPEPIYPTQAQPGSEEKLLVMLERAERNEALHHPQDRHTRPTRE